MSIDIASLRKMRTQDFGKIAEAFTKTANGGGSGKDDRLFRLEADKAGNGSATIRFLPKHPDDELPWVKVYSHAFQGPTGKWYIENSLTTIGEQDYVGEVNSALWATGTEENKKLAQKQKRKLSYYANVLVISDPKHPENEGKVMIFKFGKKIFDKLMEKANPVFEGEKPVNVFDLWEGADFKLRMKRVDDFPNYDSSVFAEPTELFGGDEDKLLKVMNSLHRLGEFTDRKAFKTYDELKARFLAVTSAEGGVAPRRAADVDLADEPASAPAPARRSAPAPAADEGEDDLAYFTKLAQGD